MNSADYVSAVLDEIALEGLDGIAHEGIYQNNFELTFPVHMSVKGYVLM